MKFDAALSFWKTQAEIARVLGLKRQHVFQWKEAGVVPAKYAVVLQALSKGQVKMDATLYRRPTKPRV